MEKVIRDGMVAVLYSPGFGAGWYSWHGIVELLFDPKVVEMIEAKSDYKDIAHYVAEKYADEDPYLGGVDDLTIEWLPDGTEFRVHEYDGSESIEVKEELDWIKA